MRPHITLTLWFERGRFRLLGVWFERGRFRLLGVWFERGRFRLLSQCVPVLGARWRSCPRVILGPGCLVHGRRD